MQISDLINGCLDAGDVPGAASGIIGHPISQALSEPSIRRFWALAYGNAQPTRCDRIMLEISAGLIDQWERV